jgi:hypothetical protein
VILIDVNLLVHAYNADSDLHQPSRDWLEAQITVQDCVALPWASLLGFLRVSTNTRIFPKAWAVSDAWNAVKELLAQDCVWIPQPTGRHPEVLGRLLSQRGMRSELVPDAHLAALAIEHGLTLCSTDADFARFKGLRWLNPLES